MDNVKRKIKFANKNFAKLFIKFYSLTYEMYVCMHIQVLVHYDLIIFGKIFYSSSFAL